MRELNSPFRDTRMAIRSDGLEMIFTSNRPGGIGPARLNLNLWVSTRTSSLKAVGFLGVPKIRALYEATYFAGRRKAGMPEE